MSVSLAAVCLALGLSLAIITLANYPAVDAVRALYDGAFGTRPQVASTLRTTLPLALVALGWILAYSARQINIGFEGQVLVGGVLAAVVGIEAGGLPGYLHLLLAVLAGVAGGAAYAGIAALLRARMEVSEILSTLLLNFIATQLVSWLVRGQLQEPTHTFARSPPILSSARWPSLLPPTSLSWDIILVPLAALAVPLLLARTTFGFRVRLTGANPEAARHVGVNTVRVAAFALVASGALAGLAGTSLILGGESHSMTDNFSAGFGFGGIVVALLARNSAAGVIPAALLIAALRQGGGLMEARVGIPSALVLITQGLVILLVAASTLVLERPRLSRRLAPGHRRRATPQA